MVSGKRRHHPVDQVGGFIVRVRSIHTSLKGVKYYTYKKASRVYHARSAAESFRDAVIKTGVAAGDVWVTTVEAKEVKW